MALGPLSDRNVAPVPNYMNITRVLEQIPKGADAKHQPRLFDTPRRRGKRRGGGGVCLLPHKHIRKTIRNNTNNKVLCKPSVDVCARFYLRAG